MKQLVKDYYALPEAAERSGHPIHNFLYLAEQSKIMLSVEAHDWPIEWGDESDFTGEASKDSKKPNKPPFEYFNSGYFNILWYEIRKLRVNGKLSITMVSAEKDGRKYYGNIIRGGPDFRRRQNECKLELSNIFISHEELQRIENHEVGNWEAKTELNLTDAVGNGRFARKAKTQAKYKQWQRKYTELKKKHPDKSDIWISLQISKWLTAQGYRPTRRGYSEELIRKNMKPKKLVAN